MINKIGLFNLEPEDRYKYLNSLSKDLIWQELLNQVLKFNYLRLNIVDKKIQILDEEFRLLRQIKDDTIRVIEYNLAYQFLIEDHKNKIFKIINRALIFIALVILAIIAHGGFIQ